MSPPAYPSQRLFPIYPIDIDDDIEPLFKQPSKGPIQLIEDDYPVEEVAPIKKKMPKFLKSKKASYKKPRTSKTTSHDTSDSTHICLYLSDEATNLDDVEVQEVRPISRDWAKKKRLSSASLSSSSVATDPSLVDDPGVVDACSANLQRLQRFYFRKGRNPPLSI
nr:hypothetical protein [Tanacetum cinerariifolium]